MSTNLGKTLRFPLYRDRDIGFDCEWVQMHMIEQRIDDDAETDKEVYNNAIRQVYVDYETAKYEVAKFREDLCNVISNTTIIDRIENPEKYDREGRLRRKYR